MLLVVAMNKAATFFGLLTAVAGAAVATLLLSKSIADRSRAQTALDNRAFVIVARHADAPGRGEPDGFDLNDCRTQRNLNDTGREEARHLGALLRNSGIHITKVLTSRWCRARETAELMTMGPVETAPAFDNLEFNKQRANELLDNERKLIASWHGPGVLLVVSHASNIKALTGIESDHGGLFVVSQNQDRLLATPFNVSSATASRSARHSSF